MIDVGRPRGEAERLDTLRSYAILDTPSEPEFDRIVCEAAIFLSTPIALISLVDKDRQWFKAKIGLDATETPRSISFCTHAIKGSGVLVVADASRDPRFSTNPLVAGEPNLRFYAGAPLHAADGLAIGTLCVIDLSPHLDFGERERAELERLAGKVMAVLEARKLRALRDREEEMAA